MLYRRCRLGDAMTAHPAGQADTGNRRLHSVWARRASAVNRGAFRATLLATSSALAMILGLERRAEAAPVCSVVTNHALPYTNTGNNCITYTTTPVGTGDVVNAGAINAGGSGAVASTATGIGVHGASTINGSIINQGSIFGGNYAINVGSGPQGAGSDLTGSIVNDGSITGQYGISSGALVEGSIVNNSSISTTKIGIDLSVSSLGGSIINNGGITSQTNDGINVFQTDIGGSITNNGTITAVAGSAGIVISGPSSIAGSVTNNGTINAVSAGMYVFPATIAGSFGNTASGTITAAEGMYVLSRSTAASSVAGNFFNAGKIIATASSGMAIYSASVGGAISNSGTITAPTYGILVLKYAPVGGGPATVAGGITNSGSISGAGAGFAGIAVAGGSIMQGITNTATGKIDSQGAGILVSDSALGLLAGAATVTGGITNRGAITALTGIAVVGSTVSGDIANSGSISGNVGILASGSAPVSVFDSGTLIGTGGTAVDLTQNAVGNAFTLGPGYAVTGNVLGQGADTFQLGGAGSGAFDLATIGPAGQYRGFTTFNVVSGTWTVSNTFGQAQPWNVDGGVLAGAGTLSAVDVNAGGTLMPGQPRVAGGAMNISGNLTFAPGSTYFANVSPSVASIGLVAGTATLNGTLDANGTGGAFTDGKRYTVLTADGSLNHTTFANLSITGSFGSMMPIVSYDLDENVILTLAPAALTRHLPSGSTNVVNVANAIDGANVGTPPLLFQNLFSLAPAQLESALTQLSGESANGAQQGAFQFSSSFLSLMLDPYTENRGGGLGGGGGFGPALAYAGDERMLPPAATAYSALAREAAPAPIAQPRWNLWGAAFGGSEQVSGNGAVGSHNSTSQAGGFAAGGDYHVSPDAMLGFALAGGGTSWSVSGLGGGSSDVFQAGLYGAKEFGPAYVSGALAFGEYWMKASRTVSLPGGDTYTGRFDAQGYSGRIESGYHVALPSLTLTPYGALQVQAFEAPAYGERAVGGATSFALSYHSQSATDTRVELGFRADKTIAMADGAAVKLFGRLAWAHDWESNPAIEATFIGLPAASFVVNGARQAPDRALVTTGVEWRFARDWTLTAKFDGEFGKGSEMYAATGRVSYTW